MAYPPYTGKRIGSDHTSPCLIDVNADGKDDILYGGIKLSVHRWTGVQNNEDNHYNPAFQLLSTTPFDNFVFHDPPVNPNYAGPNPGVGAMDEDLKREFDLVDLAPTACE